MAGVSDLRSHFRSRMATLSLKEWDSPFEEQIPENIADRTFHLILGEMAQLKNNQRDLEVNVPVALNVYLKGYRKNIEGYDKAVTLLDSIITTVMAPTTRLTQAAIKNLVLTNAVLEPMNASNDNIIRIRMEFTALVLINL